MQMMACGGCGTVVPKRPRDLRNSKSGKIWCTTACYWEHRRTEHPCPFCGATVIGKRKKYCNKTCANKGRTGIVYGQGRPNSVYATTKAQRAALVARDGPTCLRCGYERYEILVVHHLVERQHGGSDQLDNLQLICPNCHAEEHYASKRESAPQ